MKTLNKKHRKFKLSLQIAAILSCVAIASVGFASWIIVGNSTQSTNGSITAYTVSESNFSLTAEGSTTGNIVLGKPASSSVTNPWLVAGSDVAVESLTATFKVNYTAANEITSGKISVSLSALFGDGESVTEETKKSKGETKLKSLLTNNYIEVVVEMWSSDPISGGTPADSATYTTDITEIPAIDYTFTESNRTGSVWVKVIFNWGTAFAKSGESAQNPYDYFNKQEKTAELATAARTALTAIYNATTEAVDGVTGTLQYAVTITATGVVATTTE